MQSICGGDDNFTDHRVRWFIDEIVDWICEKIV